MRGFAAKADDAVAAADADMDWSKLENLATSDEAKRMVANLRGTFKDEMQKLEAIAPEASLVLLLPLHCLLLCAESGNTARCCGTDCCVCPRTPESGD